MFCGAALTSPPYPISARNLSLKRFCNKSCATAFRSGPMSPRWDGGRTIKQKRKAGAIRQKRRRRRVVIVLSEKQRERGRENCRSWQRRLKAEVLTAYGSVCACCGEANESFLTIDHIHRDGAGERAKLGGWGNHFYRWLKVQGFPQGRYRILCMNCNWATRNGESCPHVLQGTDRATAS